MKQLLNLKSYLTFLSRNKVYTAINVFGLSISLMFVLIIGVYIRQEKSIDRQHGKANRIYSLGVDFFEDGGKAMGLHHAVLKHFRQKYPEVENTCGFLTGSMRLDNRGEFYNAVLLETDSTFFSMFDFPLLQGDRLTCLKDKKNAVVTQTFARKWFGTDDVLGREIVCNDSTKFRVTGVVKDFTNTIINDKVEMIVDFSWEKLENRANMDEYFPKSVNFTGSSVFLQVREGTKMFGREKEFTKFVKSFWPSFNEPPFKCEILLERLDNLYFSEYQSYNDNLRTGNRTAVGVLFTVGLVILLFAIMNYVNLTVAQSGYRSREAATHRLFGARRSDIIGRFVVESSMLCLLSLVIAEILAVALMPMAGHLLNTRMDATLLYRPASIIITLLFILVVGVLSGIMPAFVLSKTKPIEVIRGTFRRQTKMVLNKVFITIQNVITIVMLACAVIMSLQMQHLIKAPLGFNTKQLICLQQGQAFAHKDFPVFLDKVKRLPSVSLVVSSMGTPQDGGNNNTILKKDKTYSYQMIVAEPDFLKIYGLKLKDDHRVAHRPVIYLNEQAIQDLKMKPGDSHMSQYYSQENFYGMPKEAAFGGTLADFKLRNIVSGQGVGQPFMLCLLDKVEKPWAVTVQVEGDIFATYREIERIYKEVFHEDLNEPYPFVDKYIEQAFEENLRVSHIVLVFSFVAILISLLGLIAMSTYFIGQRSKEIALRKVFGSTSNRVRLRLIRTFLNYVLIAFVVSVPVVWYVAGEWISRYSYRITWWYWIPVAGIIVLLISFAAVVVQSYVASNENPVKHIKDNQ